MIIDPEVNMRLDKIRVQGFQSFDDSGDVEFADGFNLIIGQNNSGKSALLRAMQANIPDDRHRNPGQWESFRLPEPKISVTISASGSELRNWILRLGGQVFLPVSKLQSDDIQTAVESIWRSPRISVDLHRSQIASFSSEYPALKHYNYIIGQQVCAAITVSNGDLQINVQYRSEDSIPAIFWDAWAREMFYFSAERLTIGEAPHGHGHRLASNASNLPNVLHTLLNERGNLFRKLVGHLTEIFPTVGNVSIRTRPDTNNFEIRIWPTPDMDRVELSFPLNSSGTGVAQAIAILTAIMTVENTVIIIDEINSFLHPSAVKSLLRILQTHYTQHQYIISTHAPEVISFSNAKTVHLVKRDGYESKVKLLNLDTVDEFKNVADHLGVSMADVFAADRVIWVEGPTEELSFPYLYQVFTGHPIPCGTIITSVAKTGDFNRKRDREIVYEVYNRLSSAAATLVVAIVFSFDTEELNEVDRATMIKDAGGHLSFLPRRHIECYLLDPEAIASMIIAKDPSSANVVTGDAVAAKLADRATDQRFYIAEWAGSIADQNWQTKVDAAKIIGQAVSDMSDGRAVLRKKEDSLTLIQDIVARDREKLRPLFEYVDGLIGAVTKT